MVPGDGGRGISLLSILAAAVLAAPPAAADSPRPAEGEGKGGEPVLRQSEVVFMSAADPEDYKAYGATFVAWGGADTAESVKLHRDLGIRCTGSVWCLTAGAKALHDDAKLREATAVDIEGKPIPVPWLFDHTYEGQKTIFGNTNHPAFRDHVKAEVRRVMAGGAEGLHVDDHLGVASPAMWYGGGFDPYSVAAFRKWLASRAAPGELAAAGVKDLDSLDYAALVRRIAPNAEEVKRKAGEIPLFGRWKEFHLNAAADFVEELRATAAGAAGHPVLLSANACLGNEAHHHVVPRLTHVVCEVWFEAAKGTGALGGALAAFASADRLGRPLACTASGHDWSWVKDRDVRELPRLWIALTYACGQRFMVPHPKRQWCFDEKRGTRWYAAPVEAFAPLYRFIRESAPVLDGYAAAGDLRVTAPPALRATVRRKGAAAAVHLVNVDYDIEADRIRPVRDARVAIAGLGPAAGRKARLLRPGAAPADLAVEAEGGGIAVRVPEAGLWSIIAIE